MPESAERLSLKNSTTRELFLLSANRCAYPGCTAALVTDEGYVGMICHIEGVKPGSARHNPDSTNEKRRHTSNLMLMCRNHGTIIDQESAAAWPVKKLRSLKKNHESKTLAGITAIEQAIEDVTQDQHAVLASNGRRVVEYGGRRDPVEPAGDLEIINGFLEQLARLLARQPREVLVLILIRGRPRSGYPGVSITQPALKSYSSVGHSKLRELVSVLEYAGFVSLDLEPEQEVSPLITVNFEEPFLVDLLTGLAAEELRRLIVDLDGSVLDADADAG